MLKTKGPAAVLLLALLCCSVAGCYTYAHQDLGPPPPMGKVPIDRNEPESSVRWGFLWGLMQDEWTPRTCAEEAPDGSCRHHVQLCDGNGAGRVESTFAWYSGLTVLATLGTVAPAKLTVYCNTERPPAAGPGLGPGPTEGP